MDGKPPQESRPPESNLSINSRELSMLSHFSDQGSPGYGNATKSAELAGYKGLPGSNQLAVQGSRTLKKARELGLLRPVLVERGCTLERAAERLAACLDAKRAREFMTKDGKIIKSEPQDDYQRQLQAVKLVFQLHGALDGTSSLQRPAVAAVDPYEPSANQDRVSEEYANAIAVLSEADAVDRESLRDVLECDAKSAVFEADEPQSGTEQPEEKRVPEDDSTKA